MDYSKLWVKFMSINSGVQFQVYSGGIMEFKIIKQEMFD